MNIVSIIMYHYVRDLKLSAFPKIKALLIDEFQEQLKFLKKHYVFVTIEECIRAIDDRNFKLPPNAVLLTFDDGYIDHFNTVFPILSSLGIQGCFFAPVKAIRDHKILNVNKIHFLLASTDEKTIIKSLFEYLNKYQDQYQLQAPSYYYKKLAKKFRLDTKEVIFIKRLLQRELPPQVRAKITDELFAKHVTTDQKNFAKELYMNTDMIKKMHQNGMYIGVHGYGHSWMGTLSASEQKAEIDKSLHFLNALGISTKEWVMSYPFGSYNDKLLALLKNRNCKMAFTSDVDIASLNKENALTLDRLDTMDLPRDSNADPNAWTLRIKQYTSNGG